MLESELEKRLKKRVERSGGIFLKFTSPGNTGVPDRIVITSHSELIFVELKRSPSFRPSKKQEYWLKKLSSPPYSQKCEVVDSVDRIEGLMEYYF